MINSALVDLLKALEWRYATKLFDSAKPLPEHVLNVLLEAPRLAPSSYGLQPWKFVVVSDPVKRAELRKHAYNQPQITDASHLIVLCSLREIDENYVRNFIDTVAKERGLAAEKLSGFRDMLLESLPSMQGEAGQQWMTHQVYLALGALLTACAVAKVDACPMEGFDREEFNRVLELSSYGVNARVLCAVGQRSAVDQLAGMKKVRFQADQVVIRV